MARYRHANPNLAGSDHLQWYKNSQVREWQFVNVVNKVGKLI